jgi:hypothetical protein
MCHRALILGREKSA